MSKINIKNVIRTVFTFLSIVFCWMIFENRLMELFDNHILPIFSNMIFSKGSNFVFVSIALLCSGYEIWQFIIYNRRYHIPLLSTLILSMGVVIYAKYRIKGDYISVPNLIWNFGYSDILIILLSIFLIPSLLFFVHSLFHSKKKEKNGNFKFLTDNPIDKLELDILDYSESVKYLVHNLETIETETSCSIGLIAPWGTGKTSYMNFLEKECLNKNKFIVVKFNPRHSVTPRNIQEDFFEILFSELRKYDSKFSFHFINYLEAINIVAENRMVSGFLGFHKLWNKDFEKEKINEIIRRTGKKVIILIEDLDRLLANEIVEVFKLIDGNASFLNLIFITAYDKRIINKIIQKEYYTVDENTLFSDKFFTLEFQLPLRPFKTIYNYFIRILLDNNIIDNDKKYIIDKYFESGLLKKYIATLRDAKRLYNLFVSQYNKIHKDIEFENYFLLCLMRYKYYDEYFILYTNKEEYISSNYMKASNRYFINEQFVKEPKSKDILEILFSELSTKTYRSINEINAFDIYFFEKVYDGIPMKKMGLVFSGPLENAKLFIDNSVLENKFKYLITFLDSKNISQFINRAEFERYLDLLFYINCKSYDVSIPYLTILKLFYKETQKQILNAYRYEDEEYDNMLLSKLQGSYPYYPHNMTQGIIIELINKQFKEEIIFTKEDVLNASKKALDNLIENDHQVKQIHISLLYSCISAIDEFTRLITLDREACSKMKDIISNNPAGYFENFVRLGGSSSSPDFNSVACEPFWEQIFGSKKDMEAFINTNQSIIPKIQLINNFWKLYKNNDYKSIEFEGQGYVQEKIQNNLEAENKDLNTLLEIERQFEELEKGRAVTSREKGNDVYIKEYETFLNHIEDVHLYVTKRGDIIRNIKTAIQSMK
ncbi:putative P-loop ATPase [Bacteroidales bacterium Barb7]|nr:putative P-loop ATPase [Bacteroidales bacterium Barb7]